MKTRITKFLTIVFCLVLALTTLTSCKPLMNFEGITLTDATFTYDQSSHNVIVNGLDAYPNAEWQLTDDEINVGVYTQTLTVKQSGYNDLVLSATLTIKKANPSNLYPQTQYNQTFYEATNTLRVVWTGNPIVVTAFANYEQKDIAVIEYYKNDIQLTGAPTEVGMYKVKITLPETQNYYSLTKEFNFEIIETQFTATFRVINPITGDFDTDFEGSRTFIRNSQIDLVDAFTLPYYEGYVFQGWYVNDEPIHSVYDYGVGVVVTGIYAFNGL